MDKETKYLLIFIAISWAAAFFVGYNLGGYSQTDVPDNVVLFDFNHGTVTVKLSPEEMERAQKYLYNRSNIEWQFNFTEVKREFNLDYDVMKK